MPQQIPVLKKVLSEVLGTLLLVFIGCGAIVVDDAHGNITHFGVSVAFGLVVMAMIYSLGDVSGAHINPAVTVAFWSARQINVKDAVLYVAAQLTGAILAGGLLRLLFGAHDTLGATLPNGPLLQVFVLEFCLTFVLMFVVLGVSTGAKEKGLMAGIAVGGTVAMCALFGGPVSGASMNPARSLGPAIVSGNFADQWLYVLAPISGAVAAVGGCRCIRDSGCC